MQLDTIELPDDLVWQDEYAWSPVMQNVSYSTTGALFIQESVKLSGRPITLTGKSDTGWIQRSVVAALQEFAETAGKQMTLTLKDGRTFNVMFRQNEKPIDVVNVLDFNLFEDTAWFKVNAIRLMEI